MHELSYEERVRAKYIELEFVEINDMWFNSRLGVKGVDFLYMRFPPTRIPVNSVESDKFLKCIEENLIAFEWIERMKPELNRVFGGEKDA